MDVIIKGRKFSITYDGQSIVTVRQEDTGDFDGALDLIRSILGSFYPSKPGSIWGCDGIGYVIEKKHGRAFQHKSGVGKIKFQQGLEKVRQQWMS